MNIIEKTYQWKGQLSTRKSTKRIILHHAESSKCSADDIHRWHLDKGWVGIGYHFFVRKDGSIYRGRPENKLGAHASNNNSDSIGICFEGSYMKETMSQVQMNAGKELVAYLKNKYGITKVQRHKDVCSTNCPGTNFPFNEIAGASGNVTSTNKSANTSSKNSIVALGQQHSINFTNVSIAVDGIRGTNTKKNGIRCVQHAMNLDYKSGLKEDGDFRTKSDKALGNHYVGKGETQYLVTAVEILLMLRGYDPKGVECPGEYGNGLEAAVYQYQKDNGLKPDKIAGVNTIKSLMGV